MTAAGKRRHRNDLSGGASAVHECKARGAINVLSNIRTDANFVGFIVTSDYKIYGLPVLRELEMK